MTALEGFVQLTLTWIFVSTYRIVCQTHSLVLVAVWGSIDDLYRCYKSLVYCTTFSFGGGFRGYFTSKSIHLSPCYALTDTIIIQINAASRASPVTDDNLAKPHPHWPMGVMDNIAIYS